MKEFRQFEKDENQRLKLEKQAKKDSSSPLLKRPAHVDPEHTPRPRRRNVRPADSSSSNSNSNSPRVRRRRRLVAPSDSDSDEQ